MPDGTAMPDLNSLDFPAFRARAPWLNGDLQTLRNTAVGSVRRLAPTLDNAPGDRLTIALGDGDALVAAVTRPERQTDRPLAVLIHGLTGCEDSAYMRMSAASLVSQGYPVLRLNLRGAGPSRPLCRGQYHAGRSEDLAAALAGLPAKLTDAGIVAVGFSLGGNMLLKYLGERGREAGLLAATSISAPIDLAATQRCMMRPRNRLYHRYVLARMKREAGEPASDLPDTLKEKMRHARSVYEFDDWIVAPRNGFGTADNYYEQCGSQAFLAGIRVPTLIIHGRDDPWIPAVMYDSQDWANMPALRLLMAPGGGHVGFHGQGAPMSWHDRCLLHFFDTVQTIKRAASTAA